MQLELVHFFECATFFKVTLPRTLKGQVEKDMECVLSYSVSSRWVMRTEAKLVQNFDLAPVAVDGTNEVIPPTISRCFLEH